MVIPPGEGVKESFPLAVADGSLRNDISKLAGRIVFVDPALESFETVRQGRSGRGSWTGEQFTDVGAVRDVATRPK